MLWSSLYFRLIESMFASFSLPFLLMMVVIVNLYTITSGGEYDRETGTK